MAVPDHFAKVDWLPYSEDLHESHANVLHTKGWAFGMVLA